MVGPGERDPSAGRAGQREQSAGGKNGPDQDVGPPLRAEDRNAVDELAEHHFHRPRQAEPDAYSGEFRRGRESDAP